ncbi:Hypothetical protein A7982_01786 [Minicystis rosea]|nr:Hypothetical protein A7982_01786 [Minicystis rosea]
MLKGRKRTTLTHVHTGNDIKHLEQQLRQILELEPAGVVSMEEAGITHLMSFTEVIKGGDQRTLMIKLTQTGTRRDVEALAEKMFGEDTIVTEMDSGGVRVDHLTGEVVPMTDEDAMGLCAGILLKTAMTRDPLLQRGSAPFFIRTGYTHEEGALLGT